MPGKIVQCSFCLRNMRSDNLRRHLESCQKNSSFQKNIDHSAIKGSIFQKEAPKVAALADAIINNRSTKGS